jgi:hypothetical protein
LAKRGSHQGFAFALSIHVRGVVKIDSRIERLAQDIQRLLAAAAFAGKKPANARASEADF